MSTWNGELYIGEQLDSIINQDFTGELKIIVRDDGSSDSTISILKRYELKNVNVILGDNIGVKSSYVNLLQIAMTEDFDICALADQDDIWCPGRIAEISSRVNVLKPVLYCSALRLVDKDLNFLSIYKHPGDRSMISSLFVNFVTGCTCVFNRRFLEIVKLPDRPDQLVMHDWWLGCVSAIYKSTIYDESPSVLYRQHGKNQVGIKTGLKRLFHYARNSWRIKSNQIRFAQAKELYCAYYGMLPSYERDVVVEYIESESIITKRIFFYLKYRSNIPFVSGFRFIFNI